MSRSAIRRFRRLLPLLAVLTAPAQAGDDAVPEPELKAQFIQRFTSFVEWPPEVFPVPAAPFTLCRLGDSEVGRVLDRVARGTKVKGRPVVVRALASPCEVPGCQVVVISEGMERVLWHVLAHTTHQPVLTVTERVSHPPNGAIIGFYREGQLMRFEINTEAARLSGLKLGSGLLRMARRVEETP